MKKLAIALIMAMVGSISFANDIYIEQSGDSSNITITQDGTGNRIGEALTPTFIGGGSNTVTIDQIGSSNELDMVLNGASAVAAISVTGSGNIQTINCGTRTSSGCSGSSITQTIVGDDNTITQNLGAGANHTTDFLVTGSTNTITHTSTNTGITSANISVTGDNNSIGVEQSGTTAKSVTINSTGNLNTISITQSN